VLVGFHHSFRLSHASTPFLDFYRWGFPTAPIQVHLSIDVVNGICRQIQDYGNFPGMLLRTHRPSGGIYRIRLQYPRRTGKRNLKV
jgi:hypothetical protein